MMNKEEGFCKVRFKDAEKDVKVYKPLWKRFFYGIRPVLKEKLGLKNIMAVPRLIDRKSVV